MREIAMFLVVVGSFAYYHIYLYRIKHVNDYQGTAMIYGAEDYPQTMEYETYREGVLERLMAAREQLHIEESQVSVSEELTAQPTGTGQAGILTAISSRIRKMEEKVEQYTNSQHILGKQSFVAAKKKLDKAVGLDMTNSMSGGQNALDDVRDVVGMTSEGQLGWIQDDMDLTERIENLVDFGLQMKTQGRNFVILENPNKSASKVWLRGRDR